MKYGYPKLGDIYKFLREIVGDEALFEILESDIIDFNNYDRKRLQKEWNRLENEEFKDYSDYRFEENIILKSSKVFFSEMNKQYSFPQELIDILFQFLENFINEYRKEKGCSVPDYSIRNCALLNLNQTINLMYIPDYVKKYSHEKLQARIIEIINKDNNYEELFKSVINENNYRTVHDYIFNLGLDYDDGDTDNFSTFQDTYDNAVKSNKNPTWERLRFIITPLSSELQGKFIFHYLINSINLALQDIFELNEEDFNKIKQDLLLISRTDNFDITNRNIVETYRIYFVTKSCDLIKDFFNDTFVSHLYKSIGVQQYFEKLEKIEEQTNHVSAFFVPWIKGYICEVQNYHEDAIDWFEQAFANYNLAGDFLHRFIEMAFSLENHYCSWRKVRQSINGQNNTTTPLSNNAKMYWSLGYAINLFDKKSEDVYLESYQPVHNYNFFFPPKAFLNEEQAKIIAQNEYISEQNFHTTSSFESVRQNTYAFFNSLKTSNQRNRLVTWSKPSGEESFEIKEQKRLYTPLALCIQDGQDDVRLWELAIKWLEDEENPVDVDLLCFNGSTALHEALTQYKTQRLREGPDNQSDKTKLIRKVIIKLLEKATYFGSTTFQKQIHTLQEAIHCFDEEIVLKITDKISDSDFQNYLISADEVSPLYYLLLRRQVLLNGIDAYIEKRKLYPDNILWKNLAVPGFTENEKKQYLEKMDASEGYSDFERAFLTFEFGIKYRNQIIEIYNHIADYFINRTHNVDSFIKMAPNTEQGCTALYYAAEIDDVYICRKLLDAGADYKKQIGISHVKTKDREEIFFPNTFIYRLITFKAWKTLKVFLTEYSSFAKTVMHQDCSNITPLVYFITYFLDLSPMERMSSLNYFYEFNDLFLKNGSDLDENTEMGCARYWLEEILHLR